MNVPSERIEGDRDDKDLLFIKRAIQVEVNEQIKDLEEKVAALEKKIDHIATLCKLKSV